METRKQLAEALIKAQGELQNPTKDGASFQGGYVKFATLIEHTKPVLTKHGLTIVQFPGPVSDGLVELTTILIHSSGEMLESKMSVPCTETKEDKETKKTKVELTPQTVGKAISYARRYAWQSVIGVAGSDDAAEVPERQQPQFTPAQTPSQPPSVSHETQGRFESITTAGAHTGWTADWLNRVMTTAFGHQDLDRLSAKQWNWLVKSAAKDTPQSFIEFVQSKKTA